VAAIARSGQVRVKKKRTVSKAEAGDAKRLRWRESVSAETASHVWRLHGRGHDEGTIAVRLGIRVSTVLAALKVKPKAP